MKSLYNADMSGTKDAEALAEKVSYFLKSVFDEYAGKGYSAHEVSHLLTTTVITIEGVMILEAMQKAGTLDAFIERLSGKLEG